MTAGVDIPVDDGQITLALEVVDRHLDAFVRAVRDIQARLAEQLGGQAVGLMDGESRAEDVAMDGRGPIRGGSARARTGEDIDPVGGGPDTSRSEVSSACATPAAGAKPERGEQLRGPGAEPVAKQITASRPLVRSLSEEDEELLRSLDEETAAAVQVLRRISMGTKSIRELLEEYRATLESPPAAQEAPRRGKFRFWKRGYGDE